MNESARVSKEFRVVVSPRWVRTDERLRLGRLLNALELRRGERVGRVRATMSAAVEREVDGSSERFVTRRKILTQTHASSSLLRAHLQSAISDWSPAATAASFAVMSAAAAIAAAVSAASAAAAAAAASAASAAAAAAAAAPPPPSSAAAAGAGAGAGAGEGAAPGAAASANPGNDIASVKLGVLLGRHCTAVVFG